jgi:hypothetical protein
MLALVTVGRGRLNGKPPANPMAAWDRPRCCGVWQVARPAIRTRYSPRFRRARQIRWRHWSGQRLRHITDQILHRENGFRLGKGIANWRQRPHIDHDRCGIFVRHGPFLLIWDEREQGAFVVAKSFAYGSRALIVAPGSGAHFRSGVRLGAITTLRKYLTGPELLIEGPTGAFQSCSEWQRMHPVTRLAG